MILKFRFFDVISKKMYFMDRIGEYTVEQLCRLSNTDDDYTKVMQFTGLTDKNGKDIYSGDIVDDMFDCGQLKIIYYNEESAGFYSKSIKTWPITGKYDLSISISPETITGGEVIGNIHQHSHLLDKGE